MIATSGFLTALECTKFVFGRGSVVDPAGEAYSAPPDPEAGLRETLLLRVRGGDGRDCEGGAGRERGRPPTQIPGSAADVQTESM